MTASHDQYSDPLLHGRKPSDESRRSRDSLKDQLTALRESGSDLPSQRNDVIADVETAWELGCFGDERLDVSRMDGFAVRARREALAAKLNSGATLDRLTKLLPAIQAQISETKFAAWVAVALLCVILWRVW